ncbi:Hypothetical protein A7982_10824 [Minicystis rosea]|nr:Hypothetical protein A7982_10824 [Minicystis rosea]
MLSTAACAGTPVPAERLASAEAAIRSAAEVGGDSTPQASLHLKMARDQIAEAKKLIAAGEHERAAATLARAQIDAELSLSLAREVEAREKARALLAEAERLRSTASH